MRAAFLKPDSVGGKSNFLVCWFRGLLIVQFHDGHLVSMQIIAKSYAEV